MRRKFTALVALVTTACTGWRVEFGPAPEAANSATRKGSSDAIRIRLRSGEDVYLRGAKLVGDSIVGYTRDGRPDFARRALATSEVHSISTYGFDGEKTTLAVLLIGGASAALVALCVSSLSGL